MLGTGGSDISPVLSAAPAEAERVKKPSWLQLHHAAFKRALLAGDGTPRCTTGHASSTALAARGCRNHLRDPRSGLPDALSTRSEPPRARPARKFPAGGKGPPSCRRGSSPGRAIWWRRRRSGSREPVPAPRLPAGGGRYCCFPPPPTGSALPCPAQRVGDGAGGPGGPCLSALPMWVSR